MKLSLRALGMFSLCGAAVWLAANPQAFAANIDGTDKTGGCRVYGTLNVHADTTTWNLTVVDAKQDGNAAYAKVVVDRNNLPDAEFRSANAAPAGSSVNFPGNTKQSGTRGAKVLACIDKNNQPDTCTQIAYVAEN